MLFVHRDDVTLHDTWETLGLRGTASNDFSIDGAFVPEERGFQMIVDPAQHPWRLYRAMPLLFINHGSQALGIARAAIDCAAETIAGKKGWGNVPLAEVSRVQFAIAEATAVVESAASYLYETSEALWNADEAGIGDATLRARVRLATSHAATSSEHAVDIIQDALATSAIFATSPLERYFRDMHTAKAHVMIGSMTYEAAGRVLLGLDARFPFF
jgi:alkylation response protein AidB-like acyl-CoA dehydrogenase